MAAYLIEVSDTKEGVCHPTNVGPFADAKAAAEFASEMQMGTAAESGQGGYSAAHVISDEMCDYSPELYPEAYAWRINEEDL